MKKTLSIIFTSLVISIAAVTGCTANVENPKVDQTGKDTRRLHQDLRRNEGELYRQVH